MNSYSRNVTQAYIQSTTSLDHDVFIRAPLELETTSGEVLQVVKPLYSIPEPGLHWHLNHLHHHLENFGMSRVRADPFILFRPIYGNFNGLVLLQVDESLGLGSKYFLLHEEEWPQKHFAPNLL